ncbi:MAG: hypothetical protein EKK64_00605 [Neisseriaceae bacterium]|nr:MAG: hypothetical protein EKK64_00605 [Neisseriaceae bacterium]
MQPYKKEISWVFSVNGENWRITDIQCDDILGFLVTIEETRNNGQEDVHMYGVLLYPSFTWHAENISKYESEFMRDAILNYIRENDLPSDYLQPR